MSQKLFIDKPHEFQVVRSFGKRRSGSVVWWAWQLQQLTLFCFRWNWKNLYHELVIFWLFNCAAILIVFWKNTQKKMSQKIR